MKWLNYLKNNRGNRGTGAPAQFAVVERVGIRSESPQENDSTPYYVRGKFGIVEEICAPLTSPNRTASKPALRSYRIRFSARDVWPNLPGASGETLTVRINEDWLMPVR
jgi:nitrile hydratase beta subunit-like protein